MNLKSAEGAINGAWLTGLVVGILALINTIISLVFSDPQSRWAALWVFGELAVLFGLAYGVKRKNRVCAVLLSAYFISLLIRKTAMWRQSGFVPLGILIDTIALSLCLYGAHGAFAYYKIKQNVYRGQDA
jgi:hypothetical protein